MKYLGYNVKIDFDNKDTIDFVMNEMQSFYPSSNVVITVGKEGCLYFNDCDDIVHMEAFCVDKVKDTNAAGDIFHGAFTYAIANNYSYEESLYFANVTASLSTTKEGGRNSCPNLNEIQSAIKKEELVKKGIKKENRI